MYRKTVLIMRAGGAGQKPLLSNILDYAAGWPLTILYILENFVLIDSYFKIILSS